ncbi:MAG: GIY-YIG nuclease family protein [Candidatus Paceibacterota bacterium]
MYFVYILKCKDRTLYVGSTNNLEKRLLAHNTLKSGAHYTKIRRPVVLVYSERVRAYSKARSREAELKRMTRTQKLALISAKKSY